MADIPLEERHVSDSLSFLVSIFIFPIDCALPASSIDRFPHIFNLKIIYMCREKIQPSGIRLPWVSIISLSLFSSGPIGFLFEWKHPPGFFSCLLNADGDKKKEKKEGRSHCVPRGQSSPNLTQQLSITNPSLVSSWLLIISQPSEQAADCFWASWLVVYRRVAPC